MRVLSLFDGMSCGRLALERAGIPVTEYYASEIDKYALTVAQANWPDNINLGDVCLINTQMLPKIDLLIGGSPCQGFSFAGKGLNFNDPRSALFFEFVHKLQELKPKYFMLENVNMKQEYQDAISNLLGCKPIKINSSLVSAQNRVRLYWTNIPGVEQPEDTGVMLIDILDSDIDHKFYHTDKAIEYMNRCVNGGRNHWDFRHHSDVNDNKAKCITANHHKGVPYNVLVTQKPRGNNPGGARAIDGKTPTLTSNSWEHNNHLDVAGVVRRFSPIECERLQTISDNYTNHVSNTQRYKMLGNGWTIDVIAHIFSYIKDNK